MEKQVSNALERDWGPVTIDKIGLEEAQHERERDLEYWIKILR